MAQLMAYFRSMHDLVISSKAAQRLALTVRGMRGVDGFVRLGVTGSDATALIPRHVDVTLRSLRSILAGRRAA